MSDRKLLMIIVALLAAIIFVGLFLLETNTSNVIFNESIVGIIVGGAIGWVMAYVTFYTTNDHKENEE